MPLKKGADPYKILGLSEKRSAKDIREAYQAQCVKWSPGNNAENKEEAAKKLADVKDAFELLSDKEKRTAYDKKKAEVRRAVELKLRNQVQEAMSRRPELNFRIPSYATIQRDGDVKPPSFDKSDIRNITLNEIKKMPSEEQTKILFPEMF